MGIIKQGVLGGLLSGALFQYPGLLMMALIGFAADNVDWRNDYILGRPRVPPPARPLPRRPTARRAPAGVSSALGAVGVALVAGAALALSTKSCPDRETRLLNAVAAVVAYMYSAAWVFPLLIFLGGCVTFVRDRNAEVKAAPGKEGIQQLGLSKLWGGALLLVWVGVLVLCVALREGGAVPYEGAGRALWWFESFYRTGSIIFGGGQARAPAPPRRAPAPRPRAGGRRARGAAGRWCCRCWWRRWSSTRRCARQAEAAAASPTTRPRPAHPRTRTRARTRARAGAGAAGAEAAGRAGEFRCTGGTPRGARCSRGCPRRSSSRASASLRPPPRPAPPRPAPPRPVLRRAERGAGAGDARAAVQHLGVPRGAGGGARWRQRARGRRGVLGRHVRPGRPRRLRHPPLLGRGLRPPPRSDPDPPPGPAACARAPRATCAGRMRARRGRQFRKWPLYRRALPGMNAAAVGLVVASTFSLYDKAPPPLPRPPPRRPPALSAGGRCCQVRATSPFPDTAVAIGPPPPPLSAYPRRRRRHSSSSGRAGPRADEGARGAGVLGFAAVEVFKAPAPAAIVAGGLLGALGVATGLRWTGAPAG